MKITLNERMKDNKLVQVASFELKDGQITTECSDKVDRKWALHFLEKAKERGMDTPEQVMAALPSMSGQHYVLQPEGA